MAKSATQWATKSGADTITTQDTSLFLLENGADLLLTETLDFLQLEDALVTTKEATLWDPSTKVANNWQDQDASSYITTTNAGVPRQQENAVARVQEDGTARILEDAVVTKKAPTVWDNL